MFELTSKSFVSDCQKQHRVHQNGGIAKEKLLPSRIESLHKICAVSVASRQTQDTPVLDTLLGHTRTSAVFILTYVCGKINISATQCCQKQYCWGLEPEKTVTDSVGEVGVHYAYNPTLNRRRQNDSALFRRPAIYSVLADPLISVKGSSVQMWYSFTSVQIRSVQELHTGEIPYTRFSPSLRSFARVLKQFQRCPNGKLV